MINRRLIYCSSVRPHPPQSLQFVRGSAESGGEYRVTYAVVQLTRYFCVHRGRAQSTTLCYVSATLGASRLSLRSTKSLRSIELCPSRIFLFPHHVQRYASTARPRARSNCNRFPLDPTRRSPRTSRAANAAHAAHAACPQAKRGEGCSRLPP